MNRRYSNLVANKATEACGLGLADKVCVEP